MKSPPFRCVALLLLTVGLTPTAPRAIAAEKTPAPAAPPTTDQIHAALAAADDERCAATIAGASVTIQQGVSVSAVVSGTVTVSGAVFTTADQAAASTALM